MDQQTRRLRIEAKLAVGTLPMQPFPRVSTGPGNGEPCDACDEPTERAALVMGGLDPLGRAIQMHVECYRAWDAARQAGRHSEFRSRAAGVRA